jgi:GNAT superfamily N-acetyltransferase
VTRVREVELPRDRVTALTTVSARLTRPAPGYTAHPGELDWWWFHRAADEGPFACWRSDDAVVHVELEGPSVVVLGDEPVLTEVVTDLLPGALTVEFVATRDASREQHLRALGFAPRGRVLAELHRDLRAPIDPAAATVPPGWRMTTMADDVAIDARADASRAAFGSEASPEEHRATFRAFTGSPGYVAEHDVVAVDEVDAHGQVGSFALWWADPSGIAQVEPMGTVPAAQRRGLGRAVLVAALLAARRQGATVMRVLTGDDVASTAFYESVGFGVVDRLRDWSRPA